MVAALPPSSLTTYIQTAIKTEVAERQVFYVNLGVMDACGPAGTGCDYHPSVPRHTRLADALTARRQSQLAGSPPLGDVVLQEAVVEPCLVRRLKSETQFLAGRLAATAL